MLPPRTWCHPLVCLLLVLSSVVLLLVGEAHGQEDFVGCGGFLKTGGVTVDFSQLKVVLKTMEGLVKETTTPSPSGYFLIAVYDRGQFLMSVEGPAGWTFRVAGSTSSSQRIVLDGSGPGICAQDVDFELAGFSVSGAVSLPSGKGLSGVELALRPVNTQSGAATPHFTASSAAGNFLFAAVPPGTYEMVATKQGIAFEKSSTPVVVQGSPVTLGASAVRVAGFRLVGQAAGIPGVVVVLKSLTSPGSAPQETVVGVDGQYTFDKVSPGTYTVTLQLEEGSRLQVEPESIKCTVQEESAVVPQQFSLRGLSLEGKVLTRKNQWPVVDAEVLVDGARVAKTDSAGRYLLQNVQPGRHSVTVQKEGVEFSKQNPIEFTASMGHMEVFFAETFQVCGRLMVGQPDLKPLVGQKPIIFSTSSASPIKVSTSGDGRFCVQLAEGSYTVEPVVSDREKTKGLILDPSSRQIVVKDASIQNVIFSQKLGAIQGSVTCLSPVSCSQGEAQLFSAESKKPLAVQEIVKGAFHFDDVLPGQYNVRVLGTTACWQTESVSVIVKESVSEVRFQQSGFQLRVKSPVATNLNVQGPEGYTQNLSIQEGANTFCLPVTGQYTLIPSGCVRFQDDKFTFDTSNAEVVSLEARMFSVSGKIQATHDANLPTNIVVLVKPQNHGSSTDGSAEEVLQVQRVASVENTHTYEYSYWAVPGENLEFTPSSASLLFYPKTALVSVTPSICVSPVPTFSARPGLYFSGQVNPALGGVKVVITVQDSDQVVAEVLSDIKGAYSAGPLYDDLSYDLSASLLGYQITRDGDSHNFLAKKLSRVSVSLMDNAGDRVDGVLISLSGENRYRNNSIAVDGSMEFIGLVPGQYFVRPVLKEYVFTPADQEVAVKEGVTASIKFIAKRVAFSALGKVTFLNGKPAVDMSVEAIGEDESLEEALTDAEGNFRIRGLMPGNKYSVRVRTTERGPIRCAPSSQQITVGNADLTGLDFVGFREPSHFEVSGAVQVKSQFLHNVVVELHPIGGEDSTGIQSQPLSAARFYNFPRVVPGRYKVQLTTRDLNLRHYQALSEPVEITVDHQDKNVGLQMHISTHPTFHGETVSIVPLLIAGIVAMVVFKKEMVLTLIAQLKFWVTGKGTESPDESGKKGRKKASAAQKK